MQKPRPAFIIIMIAVIFLVVMSLCPWNRWSGGRLKNFNLLADLMPQTDVQEQSVETHVDPELTKLVDTLGTQCVEVDTIEVQPLLKDIPDDFRAPRIDGNVIIEDYSFDNNGLSFLAAVLEQANNRNVRIAMVGDSYIEGDILAQDIRAGLQSRYGGKGVGYVPAYSAFPGFRSSVNQSSSGWEEHEIRKMKNDRLRTILGTYFTALPRAASRFRGSDKPANVDSWNRTSVVFLADSSGTITFSSPDFSNVTFDVSSSAQPQCISYDFDTKDVSFSSNVPSLKVLGFWLEGQTGIVLDGISLRGNSGISHRVLNESTTSTLRNFIDYDIIILEFGMNALSAQQTNYTAYGNAMVEVVNNLKKLYPKAQILMMGVGDRGQKNGTSVISMPTVTSMIRAQRDVARRTGSLFWDTREAMGGDRAAAEWHERKLLNSDYVHLNHRGGKALADIFLVSLDLSLKHNE